VIPLIASLLAAALSLVAAGAAVFAAVWARSGAQKVDDVAAIVIPLLSRVKQKVDPDPMVASVVAAAAAAPPPAIIEPSAEPPTGAAPLPVIITEDDDERRESAPVVEPDEHSPTIPMTLGGPPTVEPPETGPSRSGARARTDGAERAAGYFAPYVVPPEQPAPDTLALSSERREADADPRAERRRRAHALGQETERRRQLDARKAREADEIARKVGPLSDEEAARPSGDDFAMDRPSWEGRTAVHERAALDATPRPKADSSPTLTSAGIAPGPRQRFDPRVEPESPVDVTRPHPSRWTR
jgi:hypothetical protein